MTFESIAQRVAQRAQMSDKVAYVFLANGLDEHASLTWRDLHENATNSADRLRQLADTKSRVLLALPTGLKFVEAVFACWYAGMIPVPISLPRHRNSRHRLQAIVDDVKPSVIVCEDMEFDLNSKGQQSILNIDNVKRTTLQTQQAPTKPVASRRISHKPQDIGLLQYTSGSTGVPRGVQVTHANLAHNSQLIANACELTSADTLVGWLPLYHDMGLVGSVIQTAWTGARLVFMPPERFLMHPIRWLLSIQKYQATVTGGPNSAFDLCAERIDERQKAALDLSSLRCTLNGSEPIRMGSMKRFETAFLDCGFSAASWRVCYGLAEATLLVSLGSDVCLDDDHIVSSGVVIGDQEVAIVDPDTRTRVGPRTHGEIWLKGPSCAQGYWQKPKDTAEVFGAHIVGEQGHWLRTGDLGYLKGQQLYVTDRLKDLIIVAGRNHSPLDIEATVGDADSDLSASGCAAFSVDEGGADSLVIVAELSRAALRDLHKRTDAVDIKLLIKTISLQVAATHGITPKHLIITPPGTIPRTTSGKIQRRSCRNAFLQDTLQRLVESS